MSITQRRNFLTLILIVTSLHFSCYGDEDGQTGGEKRKVIDEWETEEPHYDVPEWEGPQGVQTLEFGGGNLNDGDKWSNHMPMELKCDGCRAVAYAIKTKLKRYQKRYRERHILSESDVVELMDQVCHNTNKDFDGYGLKEILGIRRLSGPGLETKDVPGVSHGGGKWPYRLQQMCQEYVEEIGEYRIYKQFLKHRSMENILCRNKKSELGWICPRKKKKKKKDSEEGDETGSQAAPEGSEQTQDAHASSTDSGQPSEKPAESSTETKPEQTQAGQDSNQPQSENTQPGENAKQNEESKPQQDSQKPKDEDVTKPEEKTADEKKSKEDAKKSEKDGTKADQDLKQKDGNTEKPKEDAAKDKGDTGLPNGAFETPYDEAPKAAKKPKTSAQQDEKRNTDSKTPKENAKDTKEAESKESKKPAKEEL